MLVTAAGQNAALIVNYSYDSMSRLIGASDTELPLTFYGCTPPAWSGAVTWASNAAYNAAGQLTGLQQLGSVNAACTGTSELYFNQAWQYNALNQLSEIDTSAQLNGYPAPSANPGLASSFFERYHYAVAANNGQITQTDDARLGYSIGYSYDPLKRLTATTMGQGQTFSYDGFGNLTAKSVPAGSAEPVFPGVNPAKNQLTGVPYDANGNVTALNNFGLTYDMENRLVSATSASSVQTYNYDAANHRIEQIWSGNDTVYFYGPNGKVLAEFSLALTPGVSWYSSLRLDSVYFGGMLLGTTQGVATTEYSSIVDRLGTGHPGYAYGTDIPGHGSGSGLFDFATYLNDSITGFEYANQRWYSAGMGRFLTVDPSGKNVLSLDPLSWNRYSYGSGDPVGNNDPLGLFIVNPNGPLGGGGGDGDDVDPADFIPFGNSFFPHVLSPYERASNRLSSAQDALEGRSNFSPNCQKDLGALSKASKQDISLASVQVAVANTDFRNGTTSNLPVSALFGPGAQAAGASFQRQEDALYGPRRTIANEFGRNPNGLTADTVWGGSTIFINPTLIGGFLKSNESLLFHEALHELGMGDTEIQAALGIKVDARNTKNISTQLQKDCINGKGNN